MRRGARIWISPTPVPLPKEPKRYPVEVVGQGRRRGQREAENRGGADHGIGAIA